MLLAGRTYFITRRVRDRTHLFRPDPAINQVFLYCLFVTAEQLGIQVHAAVQMGNHLHLVVTDPTGHLSVFLTRFHRLVAKCTQTLRGWQGTVFEDTNCSVVALLSPEAVVQQIAYTVGNPVRAHLVERWRDWPGVSQWCDKEQRRWPKVTKPSIYFRKNNRRYPLSVAPVFSVPQVLMRAYGERGARSAVRREIRRIERQSLAARSLSGQAVVGARRVCSGSTRARPRTVERVNQLNPHFAVGRGQRSLYRKAATELKAFRDAYRRAFSQWRRGDRDVCFPPGTFWMVYAHGASVAA